MKQQIELLDEMPGIGLRSAERILAETGVDMNRFYDAQHFTSWCGLAPGCNESAGKMKSSKMLKGNKVVRTVMVECAISAIKNKK